MFFGPLLLVGLIVAAIWFFQQQQQDRDRGYARSNGDSSQPLEVLRTRYARGEISRDEYEQIRRDLERS